MRTFRDRDGRAMDRAGCRRLRRGPEADFWRLAERRSHTVVEPTIPFSTRTFLDLHRGLLAAPRIRNSNLPSRTADPAGAAVGPTDSGTTGTGATVETDDDGADGLATVGFFSSPPFTMPMMRNSAQYCADRAEDDPLL